ncbi:MAG: alcohol dehydrogenase catalytic domain-containing protein [Deltaproteobacteria bacterium]|nr:alcohol dehydrogenase catalytic domain-containing protein [Deltaproteobacteria bacterium]
MERQARYQGPGRIGVVEAATPVPGLGQVRLRVQRCGICGSDLHAFRGRGMLPPSCPGHEMSGIIDAVGARARGVREGDRVTIEPLSRCGKCAYCLAGDYHLCPGLEFVGLGLAGGMATHVLAPDYTTFALPREVDFELGALAEPTAVAVHAARLGGVTKGSRVLVLGAGTIGLLAAAACGHAGAGFVAITARHPHQRALAEAIGVDQVLHPDEVGSLGEPPQTVIETVGGEATTVSDAVYAAARGGSVVIVGLFEKTPAFEPLIMLIKELRLVGSMVYNRPRGAGADFEVALELLSSRAQVLRRLITHTFDLEDIQKGFETASDKHSGAVKVLLAPNG